MPGISISYPNDYVYIIIDRRTKYATVMPRNVENLTIREIKGIDKDGYYYSTEEKAKEAMHNDTLKT